MQKNPKSIFKIVLGSCYLQEDKLQIIKIFTTCVKKLKIFSKFLQAKCPYPKCKGWKQKQDFLSTSASCLKGLLPAKNIEGSSVEINVSELILPSEIT